ncbi:type IV pilus biogenesis protein PilM [Morganella psychrotolerans]|uniref:type IV pilus biogenesis protein PilM n=1 Tax=Morganella psychrotolerans TaxID=368603 RepID=UPI0039AF929C
MGYLLLSFFLVIYTLSDFYIGQENVNQENKEIIVVTTQRATETIRYIDAINDYIYDHPEIVNSTDEIVLSDSMIGMKPGFGIRHVIWMQRVYVWQYPQPGLTEALMRQTNSSALLGTISKHQLIDLQGNSMQVSVPASLPDHSVVYLN